MSGRVLDGRYRLLELLGQGGAGRVWKALDLELGQPLALKLLVPGGEQRPDLLYRLRREFRAARRIRHPNVVKVRDFHAGQLSYYTMELVAGVPISQSVGLGRGRSLDSEQLSNPGRMRRLLDLLEQVLSALDAIHAQGIVHRDLKPANILVELPRDAPPQAKIVDFGLARDLLDAERITRTGVVVGSLSYIAPEQAMAANVDARADLYALGIICYLLFAGRLPFKRDERAGVLLQHLQQTPEPPRRRNPGLPVLLERFTLRLLAKQPDNRFQSAAEALRALQRARQEIGWPSRQASAAERPAAERPTQLPFRPRHVGRERELEALLRRVEDLDRGRGGLLAIRAEPGAGSSRLAEELASLARSRGVAVLRARFTLPAGAAETCLALIEELESRLEVPTLLPAKTRAAPAAAQLVPALDGHERRASAPVRAVLSGVEQLLRRGPQLLCIECGVPSLLLERLLSGLERLAARSPLLVLAHGTPPPTAETIELEPLSTAHARVLVGSMLGDMDAAERLVATLEPQLEGRPLVIEQTILGLALAGVLSSRAGRWLFDAAELDGWRRLNACGQQLLADGLAERCAGLAERERQLLALVLVAGNLDFEQAVAALGASEDAVVDAVDSLLRQGLLLEDPQHAGRFGLWHHSMAEPLAGVLAAQLEAAAGQLLAIHAGDARRPLLARARWRLWLPGRAEAEPEDQLAAVATLDDWGDLELAEECARVLLEPTPPVGPRLRLARAQAWWWVGRARASRGEVDAAFAAQASALAAARGASSAELQALALSARAELSLGLDRRAQAREALAAARRGQLDDAWLEARLAVLDAHAQEQPELGRERCRHALELLRAVDAPLLSGLCLELLAASLEPGAGADAAVILEAAAEAHLRAGARAAEARARLALGERLAELGDAGAAAQSAARARQALADPLVSSSDELMDRALRLEHTTGG